MAIMTSFSRIPRIIWVEGTVKQTMATREMVQGVRETREVHPAATAATRDLVSMPSNPQFPQFLIQAAKNNEDDSDIENDALEDARDCDDSCDSNNECPEVDLHTEAVLGCFLCRKDDSAVHAEASDTHAISLASHNDLKIHKVP